MLPDGAVNAGRHGVAHLTPETKADPMRDGDSGDVGECWK